ncbi:MAG: flavin reductase, partial [Rubrobacter sp.]|nr:flavin reductase [Rubrobacter sp.]
MPPDKAHHPESGWENLGAGGEALKRAMRHFPSGVTVVTSGSGERAEGMTANAVISVSLDPPLMLVSVHRDARLNPRIREERSFAINILADDQEGLSRLFASPERSSGLVAVRSLGGGYGRTGAPLAAGALAAIECELEEIYPGGDHDLFLGRVVEVRLGDTRKGPL